MYTYTIGFRVDGGQSVGLGHMMRCLSLAKEFQKADFKVVFISKLKDGIELAKRKGFNVTEIHDTCEDNANGFFYGDITKINNEIQEIIDIITKCQIDVLIVDTYNVNEEYFLRLKPYVKQLVYIDDINKFVYPVDILINGNVTANFLNYKKYCHDEILLLGLEYNLIRDEFQALPQRDISEDVKQIMITTGGSDPYNITVKFVNWLLEDDELKHIILNVIVGSGFKNLSELRRIQESFHNVRLHENVRYISQIMLQSDIAISAGGCTLYELCACGTPVIAFIIAENQRFVVEEMDKMGYVFNIGWYGDIKKENFLQAVKFLMGSYKRRKEFYIKGRKLVDAKGTKRIVEVIQGVMEGK